MHTRPWLAGWLAGCHGLDAQEDSVVEEECEDQRRPEELVKLLRSMGVIPNFDRCQDAEEGLRHHDRSEHRERIADRLAIRLRRVRPDQPEDDEEGAVDAEDPGDKLGELDAEV